MWRFWEWVYARLYVRSVRNWPDREDPTWAAVNGVSFVMGFNGFALFFLVVWAFQVRVNWAHMKVPFALFALGTVGLNYWRFIRRKAGAKLVARMLSETEFEARRDTVKLWAYIIGSIVAPVVIAMLTLKPGR